MADAETARGPPTSHNVRPSPIARLAAKAATMMRGRDRRLVMTISEARGDARGDQLEEDGGSVMGPEQQGRDDQHCGQAKRGAERKRRARLGWRYQIRRWRLR